jgi:hypothetical protein
MQEQKRSAAAGQPPAAALSGMAPASKDAGPHSSLKKSAAAGRAPRRARSALVAVRTGEVPARQGRRGMPALNAANIRTGPSVARVAGHRFQDGKIGLGGSPSGRGAGAARFELSRGLTARAAKAVSDSLCLVGRNNIATSEESQVESTDSCVIGVHHTK